MINLSEFTFLSSDGVTALHTMEWTGAAPRAILQLVHGVSEHISRYDDFARFLAAQGFVVVGHDHLGHGASVAQGDTPIFFREENGWDKAVDDVYALSRLTRGKYPALPYFLLGHSMGSFLTRTLLIRYPDAADGAILMGTGWNSEIAITGGRLVTTVLGALQGKRATSKFVTDLAFGGYSKAFAPNRTGFDWVAAEEASVDRYIADPLCGQDATIGLFHDMLGGFRFNQKAKNVQKMRKNAPILLISGGDDPVGAMGKGVEQTRDAFLAAGMQQVSTILYPGLRHEILNETAHRQTVYGDLLHWLEDRLG